MGLTVNPFTGKLGSGSPSLRFNPLAGEFQFSGGTNRIEFDPTSGDFAFVGPSQVVGFTYLRPDGVSVFHRPDSTSLYLRP